MINALKYTEELEKAGFTPEQAKVSVNAWMDLMNNNFATRGDLKEYQFMTRTDLRDLEAKLISGLAAIEIKFDRRCDKIDKRCDELDAKIDKRCDELTRRFDKVEGKFSELEYRLTIKMGTMMTLLLGVALTIHRLL